MISGVISPLIGVISVIAQLLTPLITTHEPPSRVPRNLASFWWCMKADVLGAARSSKCPTRTWRFDLVFWEVPAKLAQISCKSFYHRRCPASNKVAKP